MEEEKILEIFKKHSVYRDSEAFIKDVEMFGEDEDGEDLCFDENFIVEDVDSYMNDYIQYIKLDFVKEIIKESKAELRQQLIKRLETIWRISNNVYTYELLINDTVEDLQHREEWK